MAWLTTGPLHVSEQQLRGVQDEVLATKRELRVTIRPGALRVAGVSGERLAVGG